MGELILMLLLTCAVCGGIPALAFAYINGKIKFFNRGKAPSEKQKRTVFRWLAFLLGSFMELWVKPRPLTWQTTAESQSEYFVSRTQI